MGNWTPPDKDPEFLHVRITCDRCKFHELIPGDERADWKCPRCKNQTNLFDSSTTTETPDVGTADDPSESTRKNLREKTIEQRMIEFHEENPHVYARLVELAREWKARGHKRCGMKMLFEIVRWQRGLQTTDLNAPEWKLSNDYHSRYSRLVMKDEPDLVGFFSIRCLRSA